MSEELKPCPFCGGKAHIKEVVSACEKLYTVGCSDSECMGYETWLLKPTVDEAVVAWNRRAERTCRMEYNDRWSGDDLYPTECYNCSECHYMTSDGMPSYCPNCGAKVLGD